MKKLRNLFKFKYVLVLTVLIVLLSIYRVSLFDSNINQNEEEFIFTITNITQKNDYIKYELKGKEKIIGYLYNSKNEYELGDKVYVKGKLNVPKENTIDNTFNYKKYLKYNNIFYTLDIKNIRLISKSKNIFYILKNKIINYINNKKNKEYLNTFILGDSSYLDEESYEVFRKNGITHLFSVSGMHVSFITTIIFFILSYFRVREIRKYIITFLILLFFAFLSNFSSSVLRSILFFLLLGMSKVYRINIFKESLLLLTLDIILIINPGSLYSYSLVFSFVVSFFIIYYSKELSYIKSLFYTSIISFIASFPILISLTYEVNLFLLINNVIFIPLVSIFIFPLCIFNLFFEFLTPILSFMINILDYLNNFVLKYSLNLTFSKMNIFLIIIYYSIVLIYRFRRRKSVLVCFLIFILFLYFRSYIEQDYLYSFNVKQGDSSLIHLNNKNILIDTGGSYYTDNIFNNMIVYFKSKGIRKIDYLIITHGDYDHMGWSINLVENFNVEKVIFNCGEFNDLEKDLIKVLDKKNIKYYSCIKELNIDDDKLYFLKTRDYGNENDNSSVIYTELNGYKFLFMGDVGIEVEKDLIGKYNLRDIDVLKVGHHGSKTSSSKEFINEINPKYSIISVGENNRYGHPSKEVLDNLKNSKIYRTDQDGSIMFKIKKNKLMIETCIP